MADPQGLDVDALHALSDILLSRFVLRDLLWCALCDRPKAAVLLGPHARYYACADEDCPHPVLPAKITEHRVWTRYVSQDSSVSRGLARANRHEVLSQSLRRVVVGPEMTQLRLEWWAR